MKCFEHYQRIYSYYNKIIAFCIVIHVLRNQAYNKGFVNLNLNKINIQDG